ncbi:CheY-like chemotaxis protein [Roseateles asaccharophilus]
MCFEDGLRRCLGRTDLYDRIARRFLDTRPGDAQRARAALAMPPHRLDGLLQKPVTPSTLLDTLYGVMLGADLIRRPEPEAWQPDSVRLQGRVLLVEDNDINQLVAVGLLEAFGLRVDIAADGAQALEMAAAQRFDAVLMDVQMPGMDGFEATARLRQLPGHADTPIIAMTANSMPGERERCLAAGMSDYVAKPIEPELLENCLRRWLAP